MFIDLAKVDEKGIIIDSIVDFNEKYIEKTPIQKLDNIQIKGRVYYSVTNEVVLNCKVEGAMILLDAITKEECPYPFSIDINEVLNDSAEELNKNSIKTLDIMDVLWQNIVLEVPISYRSHPDKNYNLSGDGWELVEEEKEKIDPRLAPLLELLDEREE